MRLAVIEFVVQVPDGTGLLEAEAEARKRLHPSVRERLDLQVSWPRVTDGLPIPLEVPSCADPMLTDCLPVPCPCLSCEGRLLSDGRNVLDDMTFLECNSCCCSYAAEDVPVPAPNVKEIE